MSCYQLSRSKLRQEYIGFFRILFFIISDWWAVCRAALGRGCARGQQPCQGAFTGWQEDGQLLLLFFFSRENSKKLPKFTFGIYIIGRRRDKNCQEKPLPLPRTIFCTVIFGSESRSGFRISLDPDPVSAAPGSWSNKECRKGPKVIY